MAVGNGNSGPGLSFGNFNSSAGLAYGISNTVGTNSFAFGNLNVSTGGQSYAFGEKATAAISETFMPMFTIYFTLQITQPRHV